MAPKDVKEALSVSPRHISMDAPLRKDEDNTFYDIFLSPDSLSPDSELLNDSLRKEIDRSLSTLTPREADIIKLYYGLNKEPPYSLEEIGKLFNLTRERVRQIKEKAIKRLKHTYRSKILRSYLGQ
jgi:RNA polymerase primary sigma factor